MIKLPQQKIFDVVLAIIAVIVILLIIYYLGEAIGGVAGAVLVFLGLRKTPQDKIDDSMDNIEKAGDDVEEAKKHNADSALNKFDDILDRDK